MNDFKLQHTSMQMTSFYRLVLPLQGIHTKTKFNQQVQKNNFVKDTRKVGDNRHSMV